MKEKSILCILTFLILSVLGFQYYNTSKSIDEELSELLFENEFTGKIEESLQIKLGRPINNDLVEIGKLLFFDKILSLHEGQGKDNFGNSCAGCHSPCNAFGDPQPIAIGVDNNDIVGINRTGPRNQRKSPILINIGFYRSLMWNGRFSAYSEDPFDNSKGFDFPCPEREIFKSADKNIYHLLVAQAHIPPTETPEMAGFTGVSGKPVTLSRFPGKVFNISNDFNKSTLKGVESFDYYEDYLNYDQFDDGHGNIIPDESVFSCDGSSTLTRNFQIRENILEIVNKNDEYRLMFGNVFPEVSIGKPIEFFMIAQAIAEFQLSLTFAKAPLDKYALGNISALTEAEKRGAVIFFEKGKCISCHQTSGTSNQMFSDFKMYCVGIPQISPIFGKGTGNVGFRNEAGDLVDGGNQDFGFEDVTRDSSDRFKFRASPLRNIGLQNSFFHNGSFSSLSNAITFHLDPVNGLKNYDPASNGVPKDLQSNIGPSDELIKRIDPRILNLPKLTEEEVRDLTKFLQNSLTDERAKPINLKKQIPKRVPSGIPVSVFECNVEQVNETPENYFLSQNYPNPFNPGTIINYKLSMFNFVTLKVFDILGNEIETLVNENQTAGSYEVEFDGSNYASGIYFYELKTENFSSAKRMILLK